MGVTLSAALGAKGAAFATAGRGRVLKWNRSAERLLGWERCICIIDACRSLMQKAVGLGHC